jgi:hypothetical protein
LEGPSPDSQSTSADNLEGVHPLETPEAGQQ